MNGMKTQAIAGFAVAAALVLGGCAGAQQNTAQTPATTQAATTQAPATTQATPQTTQAKPQTTQTTSQTTQTTPQTTQQTTTQTTTQSTPAPTGGQVTYIGDEAAKQAALSHAGFAASDVTELECELDTDDGTVHYDVDFKQGGMEYDYDIDATTGAVISNKAEVDD